MLPSYLDDLRTIHSQYSLNEIVHELLELEFAARGDTIAVQLYGATLNKLKEMDNA